MKLCRLLKRLRLADEADSGRHLNLQGAAGPNHSARVVWALKEVHGPHQSEVLGLVLPGLPSHMVWIPPRIGIKKASLHVHGLRGTAKKRYGFLPRRCRAPIGCRSWKVLLGKTLRSHRSSYLCTLTDCPVSRMIFI